MAGPDRERTHDCSRRRTADRRRYTPDYVLAMEDQGLFELVDGHLVEKRTGADATIVVGEITGQLWLYNRSAKAGHVMPEQS